MPPRSMLRLPWILSLLGASACSSVSGDGLGAVAVGQPASAPATPAPPRPPAPTSGGRPAAIDPPAGAAPPDAGVAPRAGDPDRRDAGVQPAPDAAPADPADAAAMVLDAGAGDAVLLPPGPAPAPPNPAVDCPDDDTLRLCLRFEQSLDNESANELEVDADQVEFGPGAAPGSSALRFGPESTYRIRRTGGAFNEGAFTIEAWIKLDRLPAPGGRATIVDKVQRFGLYVLDDGAVRCSAGPAPHLATTEPGTVQAGQWISLACTRNDEEVAAWVGGQRRAQSTADDTSVESMGGLAIGKTMSAEDPLSGLIDNVRFWSEVRTPPQLCAVALGCR